MTSPKKYLLKPPEMPPKYRLLISGHEWSGKKTMAKLLEKKYGWRIIDWMDIVANRMNELKSEYENEHHPNNPAAEDRRIGLSEHEWTEIINGKLIDSWKFFPWIY